MSRNLNRRLGDRVRALVAGGTQPQLEVLRSEVHALAERLEHLEGSTEADTAKLDRILAVSTAQHEAVPALGRQLTDVRQLPEYASLWQEVEPIISVRIATWNRAESLVDVAIASVLRQTYQRFEVVVVGDGCTDDTETRLLKLNDDRIRFHNLPCHTQYPQDAKRRWMVSGTTAMNIAAHMSRGTWLAPLDDDDEFTDDHLELLLATALKNRYEFAYGLIEFNRVDTGTTEIVGSYPPAFGAIGVQAAIYPRLLGFFEYDTVSWVMDEVWDWNLVRRMNEAGVRIGFIDEVVTRVHTRQRY